MLNPNPYLTLSTGLDFSADDLNHNKRGVVSPKQRDHLLAQRSRIVSLLVSGLALGLSGAWLLQIDWIGIAFGAACLVSLVVACWQRFTQDIDNRVQVIAGKWQLKRMSFGWYNAAINGQSLHIHNAAQNAFIEHTGYRVYYTAGTHTILSAEVLQ